MTKNKHLFTYIDAYWYSAPDHIERNWIVISPYGSINYCCKWTHVEGVVKSLSTTF